MSAEGPSVMAGSKILKKNEKRRQECFMHIQKMSLNE
jgi:hypothetical protein